ncbi:hypothetical protein R1flu_002725 [Riccia fluitans]|uniref:SDR family oxidoreductase n=1 Tax=Riccia fluitans TaxID=41844 RepID=A0ABD1Y7G6_9MARC
MTSPPEVCEPTFGMKSLALWKRWSTQIRPNEVFRKNVTPPENFANAVLFLTSDETVHVTGHSLVVDGGLILASSSPVRAIHFEKVPALLHE